MRKAHGYAVAYDKSGKRAEEMDSFDCAHCNTTCFVRPKADPTEKGAILHQQPHPMMQGVAGVCLQCKDERAGNRGLLCAWCEKEQSAGLAVEDGVKVVSNIGARDKCPNFARRLKAYESGRALRSRIFTG